MTLANAWDKTFEQGIVDDWKATKRYAFADDPKKKLYSIDTPPPYVNAPIHMGHAASYSLMDMFARWKRMTGWNVLFPLGLDRNGLPIEMAAEKAIKKKFNEMPREQFLAECKKILEKASTESIDTFKRLGISFNGWEIGTGTGDIYLTDSEDYRALTQATFIDLWNKGLIYEANRVNNYCPGCRTTIADSEIIYADLPSLFTDVKWTVKETGEEIVIGTTRPELLCACQMVIYNPADDRYKHLAGKHAIIPIYSRAVPIKAHPEAQIDKGTGLVMMCSFGDQTDIRFFREQKLEPTIAISIDGTMNEKAGILHGLHVKKARAAILDELKTRGLIVAQRQITHRTPTCERSKDAIEFINMTEFYVKQVEFKDEMRKLADKVTFYAPESKQMLTSWIDSVSIDWPISRRRYYATEIPLWYCVKCKHPILGLKGKYVQPWRETAPVSACPKCKSNEFRGETRVFDTWFDSSNSPLYILQYGKDDAWFKKNTPCSLRPQGKDIVRTWLYYTLLKCYHLTGKAIFADAYIHHHIVDEKGIKMSKSVGNIVNPIDIITKYGGEALRLWTASEGDITVTDLRCSFPRIEGIAKSLNKLWNAVRFVTAFPKAAKPTKLCALDHWILNESNALVALCRENYGKYNFHAPAVAMRNFLWEAFSSHYLELVKSRAYNQDNAFTKTEQDGALWTLHTVLDKLLLCWAPVNPMITFKLYAELRGKDVHAETFPETEKDVKVPFTKDDVMNANALVWKAKKDKQLSLKADVKELVLIERLKEAEKDFAAAHHAVKVSYADVAEVRF